MGYVISFGLIIAIGVLSGIEYFSNKEPNWTSYWCAYGMAFFAILGLVFNFIYGGGC